MAQELTITGKVLHGDKVGRTIGFPTANLDVKLTDSDVKPGVYAGTCHLFNSSKVYNCVVYFGPRLIFNEMTNSFEAYIVDFSDDIYGQELSVTLHSFIREPLPFTSLADLKRQLEIDTSQALKLLHVS